MPAEAKEMEISHRGISQDLKAEHSYANFSNIFLDMEGDLAYVVLRWVQISIFNPR